MLWILNLVEFICQLFHAKVLSILILVHLNEFLNLLMRFSLHLSIELLSDLRIVQKSLSLCLIQQLLMLLQFLLIL